MKFREVFRFELASQLRRIWPWLIFAVLLVLNFLMTRDGTLSEALYAEFFVNSPFAIAKTTVFGSLVWLMVGAVVAGEAGARDVATGMHPLVYTTSLRKREYLGGRFLAAAVLNLLLLLAVPIAIMLAVYLPGVDTALIGPFRPSAYLTAYAFIVLPNAFVATAIQFTLALRSGRTMAAYFGSLLLFFMGFFVAAFLLFHRGMGKLLDPIGVRFILEDLSHLWTTHEKSWRLLALEGTVLTNRLLWVGIGSLFLAVAWRSFRFEHRVTANPLLRFPRIPRRKTKTTPQNAEAFLMKHAPRTFGLTLHVRQTLAIGAASFRTLAYSWAGLALLVVIPLLTIAVVLDQMVSSGAPLVPVTVRVIEELTGPLATQLSRWLVIPLFIIFFAGELVWREREARLDEITDAMPGTEWAPLLGKLLAVVLMLITFTSLQTAAGIIAQLLLGFRDLDLLLYFEILFGLQLVEYLLFAVLAFTVHSVVNQKYVAHLVATLVFAFIALAPMFGVEHDLLVFGAGPGWSYTEMRGFGPSLAPWAWFKAYWASWALLLAVVARLLWVRGRETRFGVRLQLARARFMGGTFRIAATATACTLMLGAFIFYNTNVLNEYRTDAEVEELKAEYERRYEPYGELPQPRLTEAKLDIDIHPSLRTVDIRGRYRLVNRQDVAIESIHVATTPGVAIEERERDGHARGIALALDRPADRVVTDEVHGHSIFALKTPLAPGDSLRLDFSVHVEPRGFRESGVDESVVENGTYFTDAWLPSIGYQASRELLTPSDRREHGLASQPLIPSLHDVTALDDRSEEIAFEAVVSTDANQIAVAPGTLQRSWTSSPGRRSFHYASDGGIGGEWGFYSARYAVRDAQWQQSATSGDARRIARTNTEETAQRTSVDGPGQTVAIRIYHHPSHTAHLERMVRSIRASLDSYTRHFGPAPYEHVTVVERPGNGVGMHADGSQLIYSEGFTSWQPDDDPGALDMPFAVVAHEMAHQWTVPYANVEGAPVMSESIAWYYAFQVVEEALGGQQLHRLLSFMRQPYAIAPIRRGEPLMRGLDPYMSYRRGPFALHALSEYIGDERVNAALRRLREQHRLEGAPLATTLDLYRELQRVTPESLRYLLHDLFEVNTFWELATDRVTARQTGDDGWLVTLDVRARKVVYDEQGTETEVPMDERIPIGVFGSTEAGGDELSAPLHLRMHRIRSGRQTIQITVPREPVLAGVDPFHVLDWEELDDDDNIESVEVQP